MSLLATSSGTSELPMYEQTTEPILQDGETALWLDTSDNEMYLITCKSGNNFKVELTH
jgi:hypothetical protein